MFEAGIRVTVIFCERDCDKLNNFAQSKKQKTAILAEEKRLGKARDYFQVPRAEIREFIPTHYQTVLEVGCGDGVFSTHLDKPCEYWGVEPDESAYAAASGRLHSVIHGTYEQTHDQLPDSYFDLVICNDVIEHMTDHDWFFRSIVQKMKPGACLVGSIPNVRYFSNLFKLLVQKDWRYQDFGILDSTHFRFFTEKSLRRSFEEHGYGVEKFRGINSAIGGALSLKQAVISLALLTLNVVSLGYYRDTQFLQFGFCVRRPESGNKNRTR